MFGLQSFYAVFFVFLVGYVMALKITVPNRTSFCFWCFFLLFLLSGLRGETVGGDLLRYLPEYEMVANTHSIKGALEVGYHEPGYVLFIKLLSFISSDKRCFLLGTSFLSLLGPFLLFNKYSKDIAVSVLLYYAMGYYTNTFNSVRQSIAISIVLCAIPFLLDRKLIKYLILIIIAASFHYTAVIMLLIYPFLGRPLNVKRLILFTISTFSVVGFLSFSIFQTIVSSFLFKYDPEQFLADRSGSGYGMFVFYFIVFLLMTIYYFNLVGRGNVGRNTFLSFLVTFQLFAAAIQLTAPIYHSMIRMTFYFFIPVITLAVPYIHDTLKNILGKSLFYLGAFAIAIAFMWMVYSRKPDAFSNGQGVIPYVFITTTIF